MKLLVSPKSVTALLFFILLAGSSFGSSVFPMQYAAGKAVRIFFLQDTLNRSQDPDTLNRGQDTVRMGDQKLIKDLKSDSGFLYKDLEIRNTFKKPHYAEEPVREKKFWRASAEWFLAQAVPASVNYFIRKDPYSHISFKNFFNHQRFSAWDWDDNQFTTNQIDHPYHGNLYFNAFRSNGYNLWQSSIATVVGSYIWETGGETQAPSINDFVNTSFAGILVGEMTHRVSRNIIARIGRTDNKRGNEITAFLVNPVNGINRWLDGKWGTADDYYLADSSVIVGAVDLGVKRLDSKNGDLIEKGKNAYFLRFRFFYNDGEHRLKRPFDQFSVNMEVGSGDSTFIQAVNVHALMYGHEFFETNNGQYYGLLTAHYDFYNNDAFFYGAQSLNYNLEAKYSYKKSQLRLRAAGGAVVLGAVPDPYLLYGDSRNYNYGSGLSYRFQGDMNIGKRLLLNVDYNGGVFFTLSGNDSNYTLNALSLESSLRVYKNFTLNASGGYFSLHGHFDDPELADYNREYPFARLSVGYSILF